ncbi:MULTISPECIES: hypothetical protein [Halorussus]|uniref:hypothetical protein n=1 Tax=Halorussus TaxID=1070314 RepID=UPI0013B36A1D|nr:MULTISPECIES: hypothetical protein [Halorussus]NHN59391.1 hypothetical protein [Halorussus sp. JP-T4]
MAGDPAALLTKTQRQRIRERFASLDDEQTRRDQQRIRDRVAAGIHDFELLVEYPDKQLQMALDEYTDAELREALASSQIVLERIRENRGLERDEIRAHAEEQTRVQQAESTDLQTLERVEFETDAERRRRLRDELYGEQEPSVWGQRANRFIQVAFSVFLPGLLLWALEDTLQSVVSFPYAPLWNVLFAISFLALAGAFLIKSAQLTKHVLIPPVRTLLTTPRAALSSLRDRLISTPIRTLRKSWNNL